MKKVQCLHSKSNHASISRSYSLIVVLLLLLSNNHVHVHSIHAIQAHHTDQGQRSYMFGSVTRFPSAFHHDRLHVLIRTRTHFHKDSTQPRSTNVKLQLTSLSNILPNQTRNELAHIPRSRFISSLISTPCVITAATILTVRTKESKAMIQTSNMTFPAPSVDESSPLILKDQTSNKKSVESTSWEQSISGLVSGLVLTAAKTTVKYPLDTATVRLQMPNTLYSIYDPITLFRGSFQGITAQLAGTLPSGAVFFAVKDTAKAYIMSHRSMLGGTTTMTAAPKEGLDWVALWATCFAVAVAQPPYWLIRNPSEVIKTRQQVDDTRMLSIPSNTTVTWDGIKDLYRGFWENIFYAYPADVIKFVLYEVLVSSSLERQRKGKPHFYEGEKVKIKIGPIEGALYGAFSTAVSQCVTTPLDVVRNRIMVDSTSNNSTSQSTLSYVDTLVELGRKEGLSGLFAGVGPKVAKAMLSGAIQFAAYEESSQLFQSMFDKEKKN